MTSKLARFLCLLVILIPNVLAQSASPEGDEKKARDEREKKTLVLVDEIIEQSQSLKLPENRVRIDIALSDSLWSRDEKRARALFAHAVASLAEITAAVDSGEREYLNLAHLPQQLRQEIMQVAANHDPRLALNFLRASRPASPMQMAYATPASEAQLEMRLAVQIADKDPQEALSLAEDTLKLGIDHESMNLLYKLHQAQDKSAADRFLGDILNRLRTNDFSNSPQSASIATVLLRTWIESNRAASDHPGQRTTVGLSLSNLDEQTARELSTILIKFVLNNSPNSTSGVGVGATIINSGRSFQPYPGQAFGILQQLKPLLPDLERLSPNQIAPLRERVVELDKLNQAQQGPWAKYQELAQNGTASELIEASKTAPPEVAPNLIQQAAWKALNQGDANTARAMLEKIADPRQRREMMLNLDRQAVYRASGQQKLGEARALLSRLPSMEDRVNILCQLAAGFAAKGDKVTAIEILGEAQGLAGDRALSYAHLQARIQIANGFEELEASRSAAMVEGVIDKLNELSTAALVLNGFDLQQYFRDGEFVINGGNQLNTLVQASAQRLGSISRKEYDRARLVAERFQRPEMRIFALLQIAQSMLTIDAT